MERAFPGSVGVHEGLKKAVDTGSKLGKTGIVGKALGPAFMGAFMLSAAFEEGTPMERAGAAGAIGAGLLGWGVGAKVGTGIGAAIGSMVLPGVGSAIGAVVGHLAGGIAATLAIEEPSGDQIEQSKRLLFSYFTNSE